MKKTTLIRFKPSQAYPAHVDENDVIPPSTVLSPGPDASDPPIHDDVRFRFFTHLNSLLARG